MQMALEQDLKMYEATYGRDETELSPGARFKGLISRARQQTGMPAVVIIDEYDAPMLTHMHDEVHKAEVRKILQEFYQTLKECDKDERFVFITGITKFSQMSIFSTLNNLSNITMNKHYASICGITESELHDVFDIDVEMLADEYEVSKEEMYAQLKNKYDGYHFIEGSEDIYNPYSLLLSFFNRRLDSYWFASGTPTFILEEFKRCGTDILSLDGFMTDSDVFDYQYGFGNSPVVFGYQTGYLTIKDYDPFVSSITFGIPNNEIRDGINLLLGHVGNSSVRGDDG